MDKVKAWIEKECPLFWQMLNNKAKSNIPKGIMDFLSSGTDNEIENGRKIFSIIEKYFKLLNQKISIDEITHKFRRELSNIKSEKQLSELFSEIAVCATISIISSDITLKPYSQKLKLADFKSIIDGNEIYGEIKRFEDKSKIHRRSILSDNNYKSKQATTRPRYLELKSKLKDVNTQLPENTFNIIFLFHSSIGETVRYVKQALFGESNFWSKNTMIESNSLFSIPEWKNVSAVCLCKLGKNDLIEFFEVFKNPKAKKQLSDDLIELLRKDA